jgi:predicted amidohydrolase
VKVAAYHAPLAACGSADVVGLIRAQVRRCESAGVEILCCPEAVIGGLADYAPRPAEIAIDAEGGRLREILAPLASDTVATIVGFTEIDRLGRLFNSAAMFSGGSVLGVYRKLHPAIRRSVYHAGDEMPVFTVAGLTFGIIICLDSTHAVPARSMAARGAAALFIPTNNGLPPGKAGPELAAEARSVDIARATEYGVSVIRADVVGSTSELTSYGSSGIVGPDGRVLASATGDDLLIAEIETAPPRGRDAPMPLGARLSTGSR